MRLAWLVSITSLLVSAGAFAQEPKELLATDLARAFGTAPAVWGARLSPDGQKVSFLHTAADGVVALVVLDTDHGRSQGRARWRARALPDRLVRLGERTTAALRLQHGRARRADRLWRHEARGRQRRRADKPVQLIEYEFAEHDIEPEHYRIDMLARIGAFLGEHLGVP